MILKSPSWRANAPFSVTLREGLCRSESRYCTLLLKETNECKH